MPFNIAWDSPSDLFRNSFDSSRSFIKHLGLDFFLALNHLGMELYSLKVAPSAGGCETEGSEIVSGLCGRSATSATQISVLALLEAPVRSAAALLSVHAASVQAVGRLSQSNLAALGFLFAYVWLATMIGFKGWYTAHRTWFTTTFR